MFIRPVTEAFFLVAGRNVLIQTFDDLSMQAVLYTFAGWFITPNSQHPRPRADLILRIHSGVTPPMVPSGLNSFPIVHDGTCSTDSDTFYVEFENALIIFGPGLANQVDLWLDSPLDLSSRVTGQLLSHALAPAFRRCGVFEIHSAGVIAPGTDEVILIAGPSGSGKSTLTTQLANCDWGYLSDDVLLLHCSEQGITAEPLRRFFALTSQTIAAAALGTELQEPGKAKSRISPQELFQREPIGGGVPGTIIFPAVVDSECSRLVQLNPAESMKRLLRLCPWAAYDKPTSGRHLQILGRLANSTSAFDLFAGKDILKDRQRAAELLRQTVFKTALAH